MDDRGLINKKASKDRFEQITFFMALASATIMPVNLLIIIFLILFNVQSNSLTDDTSFTVIPKFILKAEVNICISFSIISIILSIFIMIKRKKTSFFAKAACFLGVVALISIGFAFMLVDGWNSFLQSLFDMNM